MSTPRKRRAPKPRWIDYGCAICNRTVTAQGSATLYCNCLPKTPTPMHDIEQHKRIERALGYFMSAHTTTPKAPR